MNPTTVLIVVAIVGAVVALIVYSIIEDRKRRAAIKAWAEAQNFVYDETKDSDFEYRFREFGCLQRGKQRYANNFFQGQRGNYGVLGFDYHYVTESTDSEGKTQTQHHTFSAIILQTPWTMQSLFIRPEGWFDKLTEFVGFDDIDFESHEFSRKFYVKSPDKRWAYDVLHQATIEFLLNRPKFSIEFQGSRVIVWRDSVFKAADYSDALDTTTGILDRFPKYVLRDLQSTGDGVANNS